jgi:hypothetical protein
MNKHLKIFFNYFLIPILLIWLGVNLYSQMQHQSDKTESWEKIKNAFTGTDSWKIYLATILLFVNWGMEAWKWKLLMKPLQKLNFLTACKAIFAGTSFAANTPNRIGEYFGRMIYIEEGKRLQSIPLTVTGSFSQLIITLFTGCIGLLYYIQKNSSLFHPSISSFWLKIFGIGCSFVTIVCLLIYFELSWLVTGLTRIPFIRKYEYFFNKIDKLTPRLLWNILLISLFRYLVFVLQYILVMDAFGVAIAVFPNIALLSVLFLVMSIVPSFVILEAGIRGTVSLEIFRAVSSNDVGILASGLFIWMINLMTPAIIGVLLLLGKKVFRK